MLNEVFEGHKNILKIAKMLLFPEDKIILLTGSHLLIFDVIEAKLLLSKECSSDKIWLYDKNKFIIKK